MKHRQTRVFRRLVWAALAASLAAPVTAASGGGGSSNGTGSPARMSQTLRNDIAHFGIPANSREQSNATLRNDKAHFGNNQRSSRDTSTVQRQSPAPVVVRVDGGFDWVSAGVGAAGGFGLVLMAAAAASALRRRHRVDAAQA